MLDSSRMGVGSRSSSFGVVSGVPLRDKSRRTFLFASSDRQRFHKL
jgi:hypothetical protein